MIRKVKPEDVEEFIEMIMRMSQDHCKVREANPIDIAEFFMGMADNENNVFLAYVPEENGPILGAICFMIVPFMWNLDHIRAVEVAYHADPILSEKTRARVMIELLNEAEKMLFEKKVDSITIGTQVHNDLGHYLEKRGYNFAEKLYMKAVPR